MTEPTTAAPPQVICTDEQRDAMLDRISERIVLTDDQATKDLLYEFIRLFYDAEIARPQAPSAGLDADRFARVLSVARWAWATMDNQEHGDGDLTPECALDEAIEALQPGDLGDWHYDPTVDWNKALAAAGEGEPT